MFYTVRISKSLSPVLKCTSVGNFRRASTLTLSVTDNHATLSQEGNKVSQLAKTMSFRTMDFWGT